MSQGEQHIEGLLSGYDDEFTLVQLLNGVNVAQLLEQLHVLADSPVQLLDASAKWIAGAEKLDSPQFLPLVFELEPVGYLAIEDHVDEAQQRALQGVAQALLRSTARYLMASSLHLEAIKDDYQALQQKHSELQQSQMAYKALSEQLEQRVEAQLQQLQERQRQLYRSEKQASIGQLAAGVAHEINNPIGFVKSNLSSACGYLHLIEPMLQELRKQGMPSSFVQYWQEHDLDFVLEDFPHLMEESLNGIERVAAIVKSLRHFSAIDRAEEELVELNEIIENAIQMVSLQAPPEVTFQCHLTALPRYRCMPADMGQLLMNILLNGVQACVPHGKVEIRSRTTSSGIEIVVEDNGVGIEEAQLAHIFDPFFTTREVGGGVGLGLTVASDIVTAHQGAIEVSSTVGQGATFIIKLPNRE